MYSSMSIFHLLKKLPFIYQLTLYNHFIHSPLKGAVSRDFCHLFYFLNRSHLGPLINRLKWFCLNTAFAESEIEMSANLKLANTARSLTPRRLTLRGV